MAEAGVPRDHIAKVLNHMDGGPVATRIYDRYAYDKEKRDALERWAHQKDAKNAKYQYGTQVEGAWYWYESWVAEVRKHCQANAAEYKPPEQPA